MVVKILNTFFTLGNFLALTPSSVENRNPTVRQNFNLFLAFLFYAIGAMYCLYQRTILYTSLPAISLILRLLIDFTLYAHNCYSVVVMMFLKRDRWFALTDKLRQVDAADNDKHYHFVFILMHSTYAACLAVLSYNWIESFGLQLLRFYLVEYFQMYSLFFYLVLEHTLLIAVLKRYRRQKLLIQRSKKRIHKLILKKIKCNLLLLKETVNVFNDIFGWQILFSIMYIVVRSLMFIMISLNNIRVNFDNKTISFTSNVIANITQLVLFWVITLTLTVTFVNELF
jgi:hypothetical protein